MPRLILASSSATRSEMLGRAAVPFEAAPARIDESAMRVALAGEGASPRDISDALAEAKARKVSQREAGALVLGCDQVLDLDGRAFGKPESPEAALTQLQTLRGRRHALHSAAVICEAGRPLWRHVGTARLQVRAASDSWLQGYVERNWERVRHSAGCYRIEEEGIQLFDRVEGDHFTILGLPLLPLLAWLRVRGVLPE